MLASSSFVRKASVHSGVTRATSRVSCFAAAAASCAIAAEPLSPVPTHDELVCSSSSSSPAASPRVEASSSSSCSFFTAAPSLRSAFGQWKGGRAPQRVRFAGGLLRPTRPAHALVPVTPASSDRRQRHRSNSSGGSESSSSVAAATVSPPRTLISRFSTLNGTSSVIMAPEVVAVPHAPTDLLDDLPVYTPSDWNGPRQTRFSSYLEMRSLPISMAQSFFYRQHEDGNEGGRDDDADDKDAENRKAARYGNRGKNGGGETPYCRLCREEVAAGVTPRVHLSTAANGSHVSHPIREVALDSMTLLMIRGYPIDDLLTVWAETLFRCPRFPRIAHLSDPRWTIEQRAARLSDLLHAFKNAGIIDVSLARTVPQGVPAASFIGDFYRRRRVGYERLEYIGDSFWSVHIAERLVQLYPDQQWLYGERSFSFNAIRDGCEMNTNLDFVFDVLHFDTLLPSLKTESLGVGKMKADFVEAILGELHTYVIDYEPKLDDDVAFVEVNGARETQLCALIQHCLSELYDLVVLQHTRQLLPTAVPLAKELAAQWIWQQTQPRLLPSKRHTRAAQRGRHAERVAAALTRPMGSDTTSDDGTAEGDFLDGALAGTTPPALAPEANDESTVSEVADGLGSADTTSSVPVATAPAELEAFAEGNGRTDDVLPSSTAALPSIDAASLTIAASIQRGSTRVLPSLLRLFAAPQVRPTRVPHPLRELPLSAIPRATYCEHTHADVFTQIIASYHRLHLIRDDIAQTRYVVSHNPPQWSALIVSLVPQLADTVAHESSGAPNVAAEACETEYGVDGLFCPSETGTDAEVAKTTRRSGSSGGTVLEGGGTQTAELTRRLLTSMEEGELYCRDGFYDLASSPSARTTLSDAAAGATATVQWVLQHTGLPALTPKPTAEFDLSGGATADSAFHFFADSRYVPPRTRPPPAGVVTDRNLHHGVFAFLALGVADPVEEGVKALDALQAIAARGAKASPQGTAKMTSTGDGAAPTVAVAEPAMDSDEEFAQKVEAAFLFWKRQPRKPSADPDLFGRSPANEM